MTKIVVGRRKYDSRACVVTIILALLIFFELRGGRSYFDEVLCLVAFAYIVICAVLKKLSRYDFISILILLLVIGIGIISNIHSGIYAPVFSIAVDIIAESKVLWIYFAAKNYINTSARQSIVDIFTPIAQIYLVIAFACAIVSQFVNIGMTGTERYGIRGFRFIFPMSFQFLAVTLVMFAVLTLNQKIRNKRYYYVMGCISLLLATKSSPLIFALLFLFLYYYFSKRSELKFRTIVIMAIAIVFVGSYQIETYLMNEDAPRYLFFYYGGVTANRFFPFGSGFATFGSDQAARIYSPLYYEYGFSHLFGMSVEDRSFLSDTFWPMAIGQFGWIGFILYCLVYLRIFYSFQNMVMAPADQKAFMYANFISYIIHAVGSAILSASSGVIGFIALAIVSGVQTELANPNIINIKRVNQRNRIRTE